MDCYVDTNRWCRTHSRSQLLNQQLPQLRWWLNQLQLQQHLPKHRPAHHYTLDGYKSEYDKYMKTLSDEAQLTDADLRRVYESNLFRKKVTEAKVADVSQKQDQVWARHILVATLEEAQQVEKRLKNGENFIASRSGSLHRSWIQRCRRRFRLVWYRCDGSGV